MTFNFTFSVENWKAGDNCSFIAENGSDSILLWNKTGESPKITEQLVSVFINETFTLPFWNNSNVTFKFNAIAGTAPEACYIDSLIIKGFADPEISFIIQRADAQIDYGLERRRWFYNDTDKAIHWDGGLVFTGNITAQTIIEVTSNVTGNSNVGGNLTVGGITILDSEGISNWDNLSNFVQGIWNSTVGSLDIFYNKGNVGIGTANPKVALDVNGTGAFNNVSTPILTSPTGLNNARGNNLSIDTLTAKTSASIGETQVPGEGAHPAQAEAITNMDTHLLRVVEQEETLIYLEEILELQLLFHLDMLEMLILKQGLMEYLVLEMEALIYFLKRILQE